jgi:holo-[acyl-carrier protein] synthase
LIIGIGNDIIEISRIKRAVERSERFLERVFDKVEIEYFESRNMKPEFIAGRFAAKEAVVKALGTGFRGFAFKDIVIVRNELGKPLVLLKGKAKEIAAKNGDYRFFVSIAHSEENAIAMAIMEA